MPHTKDAGFEHLREAFASLLTEVEFPPGILVTVLEAKIASNSAHANFVLSVFPDGKDQEALETLNAAKHDLKDGLANSLRLRRIPDLHFAFDHTEANAAKIEQAINDLKKKGEL